jgi:hypothetical protein
MTWNDAGYRWCHKRNLNPSGKQADPAQPEQEWLSQNHVRTVGEISLLRIGH